MNRHDERDPNRLGGTSGLVLASSRGDAPSRAARERAAAALGIAVGTAAVASAGAATAATSAVKVGASGASLFFKVIVASALTATVATGVVVVRHASSPDLVAAPPAISIAAPPISLPALDGTPVPSAIAFATATRTIDAPPAPKPTTIAAPPGQSVIAVTTTIAAPSTAPPVDTDLARELRGLDAARTALDHGDASGALAALDRHDTAFPAGALATEAAVLRVEALLAHGDRDAARRLAEKLVAQDPSGPHARRLRSIASGS